MRVVDGVEMLDVREAAALADRTPETVRRWVWSGRLSARKAGNRLLVARRDVLALGRAPAAEAEGPLTFREWSDEVDRLRASGALGRSRPGASAADLVIEDRRTRD